MNAWMPVSQEMPDDEQTVLVAESNGDVRLAWHEDGEWRECASACLLPEVTHWMPLPEPPEGRQKRAMGNEGWPETGAPFDEPLEAGT